MNKQKAIELLGGTPSLAAAAMGYKSSHAIYMWPEVLSKEVADRVMWVHHSTIGALAKKATTKNPPVTKDMGLTA